MTYNYKYPHPAVTTDVVVFTIRQQKLEVLLIRRKNEPYKDKWALPGGFVDIDEDLDVCALRELQEETNVSGIYLEQLYTFGDTHRDPRERIITVAYYALAPAEKLNPQPGSDATDTKWFVVGQLPSLGFDHDYIIQKARQRVCAKAKYSTVPFQLLPEVFTLTELQSVYEVIQDESLDKRNFRKWMISLNCIEQTGEMRRNGQHRPAKLFRAIHPDRVEIIK